MPDAYAPNLHLQYLKSSAVKRPLCSNKTGQKIERQESLFMAETLTWTDACKRACSSQAEWKTAVLFTRYNGGL